jgi:hypothetical protein
MLSTTQNARLWTGLAGVSAIVRFRTGVATPSALIPQLSADELAGLEASIIESGGALDALKTWNGVLLDGHNRLDICTKHSLPFDVDEVGKDGWVRNDAEIWIIENQFHRRNLDALTRVELGLKLEDRYEARAKENEKRAAGGDRRSLAFQGR